MTAVPQNDLGNDFFSNVMPKEEIGALTFLKEHPDYDGRGVLIAVLDTGVDPGTKGLQITTDGLPKIVDVLDCTGSGDIDTSQVVKLDENGCLTGINGRVMAVNPAWKNPTGEWHVGLRPAYELFPNGLKTSMKQKRLEKFKEVQREAVTDAIQQRADFVAAHPTCSDEEQKEKTELESRTSLLQSMMGSYNDPGPIIDFVVWHDGSTWRAALDTSDFYESDEEKGKLADSTVLTNFREEHGYGTISDMDACNYVCNIFNNGNLLSIVIDSMMHGTHVAGIAAAYHPESPEFNGVAPGARILSYKIGDTRMQGLEQGMAIVRAVIAAINCNADIINISFGECCALPNSGRLANVLNEAVHKHGIVLIISAGNLGPALSTISAPACCDGAIGVGAYVSPQMAAVVHSIREEIQEGKQYTFSSRGPTVNGTLGVDISCPGGAISNVPQWCEHSRRVANGTSMAAPNATGGVALLLSGLKQVGGKITTVRVRRAIENTAVLPKHLDYSAPPKLTYGHGLLQVHGAWSYLEKSEQVDALDVRFCVEARRSDDAESKGNSFIDGYPNCSRISGIYIREPHEVNQVHCYQCSVTAFLPKDAEIVKEKLSFEMKVRLKCDRDFVKCPNTLLLVHGTRQFEVEVDATTCVDEVTYTEVQGFDVDAEWRGPLFRLPITIISPKLNQQSTTDVTLGPFDFKAGTEVRKFIPVPDGSMWAEMTFTPDGFEGKRFYYTEAKQLMPDTRTDDWGRKLSHQFTSGMEIKDVFRVEGGRMMELCIAQYWSSLGASRVAIRIEFHGVTISEGHPITLDGTAGNLNIHVSAPLRSERINPSASLTTVSIPLRPTESKLVSLKDVRDTLPDARVIHKLTLTYKLKLQEGGKITPHLPMFNRQMYDCEVETQMVYTFDINKKALSFGDVYPSPVTVKKGDYTLMAMLRHDNADLLKQLEHMPMIVDKTLPRAVSVPVYRTHIESAKGGQTVRMCDFYPGQMTTMVIGPVKEALPKDCSPGFVMNGTMTLASSTTTNKEIAVLLHYIVPPEMKLTESNTVAPDPLPTPAKLSNAARDAKIKAIEELALTSDNDIKDFETAVTELKAEYPGHLPLLVAVLKKLDGLEPSQHVKKRSEILALCDEIISCIDKVELACFLARKCPDETKEGKKRAKEATEEKDALILALEKQVSTSLKQQQDSAVDGVTYESIKPIFEELRKWADPQTPSLALMHAKFEAAGGRCAEAIKLLNIIISSDKSPASREVYEFKAECAAQLGWHHWERYEKTHININFPTKFALL